MAPIDAVAAIISIASGQLGRYPATLSPIPIPMLLREVAILATFKRNSPNVRFPIPVSLILQKCKGYRAPRLVFLL